MATFTEAPWFVYREPARRGEMRTVVPHDDAPNGYATEADAQRAADWWAQQEQPGGLCHDEIWIEHDLDCDGYPCAGIEEHYRVYSVEQATRSATGERF
jgi:hypothetical protein